MSSYQNHNDTALIALLKDSDEAAFTELYNRYWHKLYSVALHRTADENDAEEIIQEIFYKVWKNRASLDLTYSFSTYLGAAVKYAVINLMAAKGRELRYKSYVAACSPEAMTQDVHQLLEFSELQDELAAAMKQLPEKCRIVFTLSREQGYTYKEIASELNISEKTVESHISTALQKLRSSLQQFFEIVILFL